MSEAVVKIGIAIGAAIVTGVAGCIGTSLYKDNKHQKEQSQWQNYTQMQNKQIAKYQTIIAKQETKIQELQQIIATLQQKLSDAAKTQEETDNLLLILKERQEELKNATFNKNLATLKLKSLNKTKEYA